MTSDVLRAWTGLPMLPDDPLKVKIEGNQFEVHSCFNELIVPDGATAELINTNINLLTTVGVTGFGSF